MRLFDRNRMAFDAIVRYPTRTAMLLLATAIGVSAVLLLTSLGEGARRYITSEFQSIGTNLLIVIPGKFEVSGAGIAGALGGSPRDLTLADAAAIARSRYVSKIAPIIPGQATASVGRLERDITVFGAAHDMAEIRGYKMGRGRFLPKLDLETAYSVCVIGKVIAEELFRNQDPVGQWLELGDRRFRVIGVMGTTGVAGGQDVNETVFIPIASAMQLFNTERIFRVLVQATSPAIIDKARQDIIETVKARHYGHDDVTVIKQDAILASFNMIFGAVTAVLAGIAAISLLVAGTLIMNVMLVAVSQRTEEIGLIKALGASRRQIIGLFLTEAAMLSLLGAVLGVLVGRTAIGILRAMYTTIDFAAPTWAVAMAVLIALGSGLVFGILPARRAADLDPVNALAGR
jgi:putative ABC transport system permease protein